MASNFGTLVAKLTTHIWMKLKQDATLVLEYLSIRYWDFNVSQLRPEDQFGLTRLSCIRSVPSAKYRDVICALSGYAVYSTFLNKKINFITGKLLKFCSYSLCKYVNNIYIYLCWTGYLEKEWFAEQDSTRWLMIPILHSSLSGFICFFFPLSKLVCSDCMYNPKFHLKFRKYLGRF